jgi:Uncharacterised nucleotidyltransferase
VSRRQIFAALCGHLRAGLLGGAPPGPTADFRWELLIEASSHHYVSPALAWCLRDQVDIPTDVREYLDAALALNCRRNGRLTDALVRIVATLNAIDIEPVLLKGAARLVDDVYPAAKLRVLGDLDILIPGNRSTDAAAALKRIGFDEDTDIVLDAAHHHLPMLRERDTGAAVELHTELSTSPHDAIIPAAWFVEKTTLFKLRHSIVRLPEATRGAAHNIVHDQLNHGNYRLGRVQLRQLLDLAMYRKRYERMIDWTELDRRFGRIGKGTVLATYLKFAEDLLGQPMPDLSHAPRTRLMTDFRGGVERPIRALARLPRDYVLARRADPITGLKELISPQAWATGIQSIRAAMRAAKW